jgi:hypothetical protein
MASIDSSRAVRGGFERWLGLNVSLASIYLEDARFISGCLGQLVLCVFIV